MGLGETWRVSLPSRRFSTARMGELTCLAKSFLLFPLRTSLRKNQYLKGFGGGAPQGEGGRGPRPGPPFALPRPGPAPPQLPPVLRRPGRLADRDLDDPAGHRLAGLPPRR